MNRKFYLKSVISNIAKERGVTLNELYEILSQSIYSVFKKKFKPLKFDLYIDKDYYSYYVYINYITKKKNRYFLSLKRSFNFIFITSIIKQKSVVKKKLITSYFKRAEFTEAKVIISNKFKMAAKYLLLNELNFFLAKTVTGLVKKVTDFYFLVFIENNIYGILDKSEAVFNEIICVNMRLKVYVKHIVYHDGEPFLYVSRVCNEFLLDLLRIEIPEISNKLIKVVNILREPGICSKIVIKTNCIFNPIAVCLGLNAFRVRNISNSLGGEQVDLIEWNDDLRKYFLNMFPTINVNYIELNYRKKIVYIAVNERFVSKAVGDHGINLVLLTRLTSWRFKMLNFI